MYFHVAWSWGVSKCRIQPGGIWISEFAGLNLVFMPSASSALESTESELCTLIASMWMVVITSRPPPNTRLLGSEGSYSQMAVVVSMAVSFVIWNMISTLARLTMCSRHLNNSQPMQQVLLTYTALTAVGFRMHARWATGKSGAVTQLCRRRCCLMTCYLTSWCRAWSCSQCCYYHKIRDNDSPLNVNAT